MQHRNVLASYSKIIKILLLSCTFLIALPTRSNDDLELSFDDLEAPSTSVSSTVSGSTANTAEAIPSSDDLSFDEIDAPVSPILKPTVTEEDMSLPIDLPVVGTVNLIPFKEKDPKTGADVSGMKVYIPNKGKKLTLGPLTLDEGTFTLVNSVPKYSARATLFGSSVTLSIKKASQEEAPMQEGAITTKKTKPKLPSFSRIVFGITFAKKPTIQLIPGKKAELTNVDLVMAKKQPVQLIASTTILGQPVDITFSLGKKNTDAWVEFKQPIALDSIVPQLGGTPAANIVVSSCKFTAKNFTSKPKKPTVYLIDGKADISKLSGIQSKYPQEVTIKGVYTKDKSLFLLKTKELQVPRLGTIGNAKISITSTKNPKTNKAITTLKLNGKAHWNFPSIGEFDTDLKADITKKGIDAQSTLEQTVRFADIDIRNVMIRFSTTKKTIALSGDCTVQGLTTKILILKDDKGGITAQAQLLDKEIKPFNQTRIPVIKDLSLTNAKFSFEKKEKEYEVGMSGIATIFGIPLDSKVHIKKNADGKQVTLLQATAPRDKKLSDFPDLRAMKNTLFDQIQLDELTFIVSSDEYRDPENQVTYKKGVNFISKTTLSGPLVPVATFTNTSKTSLIDISGYLAPDPLDSIFRASVSNGLVIKKDTLSLGKLELEIAGNPIPAFSLLTTLMVKPSPQDDELLLTSRISFKADTSILLAGTMQGFWSNPLGIKGFEIGNVAAEIGFLPEAAGIPDRIGLAGQMTLGARHVAMALKIPIAGSADIVLCGALDKLTINDLVNTAIQLAGAIASKKLKQDILPDDINIQDMKLYVAPKATTIGELSFDQGLTVRGAISIPGFKAFGNLTVSSSGLIAQASCTEIKFPTKGTPLLLISRAKADTTFTEKATTPKTASLHMKSSVPSSPALASMVDALDSSDSLEFIDAPPINENELKKDAKESLKAARSADVACAPDSKLLADYNGPTMRIVLNLEQDLSKQGILVSGLFKVADIFEEEAFFRMDKDGIEFNFETALGKQAYKGKPLLQTRINGKSSGALSNPDFKLILDFQQYFLAYVKEQTKDAINKAKDDIKRGIASARQESDTKLTQASKEAQEGIKNAHKAVQAAKDSLAAINEQIDTIKSSMRKAIESAKNTRENLEKDIADLDRKIEEKKKHCS